MTSIEFSPGNYRTIPGVFQYSGGAAALPGYTIRRVRFLDPVLLAEGFARIERIITAEGRPMTAFCACELRSPAPFTEDGFRVFNKAYVEPLRAWGVFTDDLNPVARSNVCPEIDPPAEPSFHAFSFTVKEADAQPSFVISGSGESREGGPSYHTGTVRFGETSPDAMIEKARHVLGVMETRVGSLGYGWSDIGAAQAYTIYDIHPFFGSEIVRRGAARGGLEWHFCRPPVVGLEFEMDVRRITREDVIA